MTPERCLLLLVLALGGCASSAPSETESASGSETPTTEGASTSGSESTSDGATTSEGVSTTEDASTADAGPPAAEDLSAFPEPVRARLASFDALPVAASTPVLAITLFDASLICGFLDQHVRHEGPVAVACPDGSPVLMGGECNPASVLALRHTFGEACQLRFGDYLACEIAARESPCSVGFMRADLPECDAVNACLATQTPPE
jgi:hypothetical protein